jgi:adenosylmethionine-8-amino-7-oxononanoate aminotransferase
MTDDRKVDISKLSKTMQKTLKDLEEVLKELEHLSDEERNRKIYAFITEQESFDHKE